eukprot:TRINITY_DN29943_c0_g3_i1.p1 TRINITY_DN29943_c0_g3~~TRINITY_DN29943_c0_g3_i1.p1  ORF type:complete len:654 (-),score=157.08 TRINITY_DN29943_c0_g3_i1:511-2472(-)
MAVAVAHGDVEGHLNRSAADVFGGLTVDEIISQGDIECKVLAHFALKDLAAALSASGRTAAVVADSHGHLVGLITENDIMRAYWEGAVPSTKLSDWLASSGARASTYKLQRLVVNLSTKLEKVSEMMVSNAVASDCACHHVIVQKDDGRLLGVLSSHDIVRALCRPEMYNHLQAHGSSNHSEHNSFAEATANVSVEEVMKPTDSVITCPPTDSMRDVIKLLLTTQQNSALVVDDEGVYGLVTPRDAMMAFADAVPSSVKIADWLRGLPLGLNARVIAATAKLVEAAAMMSARELNHLVVVKPGTIEAVGSISSLDLVLCSSNKPPLLRTSRSVGSSVGELLTQPWHPVVTFEVGTTVRQAAKRLTQAATTAALLHLTGVEGLPMTMVTENDLLGAFVNNFAADQPVESWLALQEQKGSLIPQHLLVQPSVPLADAASLMVAAGSHAGRACHHLAVQRPAGGVQGVFSALDVARGLTSHCSELDVAKMGADSTEISVVMKPIATVPSCGLTDTIQHAMTSLYLSSQNAAVIVDEEGTPCLDGVITPRCAVQALADGLPLTTTVGDWLQLRRKRDNGLREVPPNLKLFDAALLMAKHSLHHLVVSSRPYCTTPVGVVSSLDLVRGVASINIHAPFVSLAWLRAHKGPHACDLLAA